MTEHEDRAKSVFLAALEYPPEQWPTFLNNACGGNVELKERVEQLLHSHEALGSIHAGASSPSLSKTVDETPGALEPGTRIGPYKLLEQIGEGGMGVVYLAAQTHPVERKVALKLIKPGLDTRQVIGRFDAERQALALMDHPNIAKVFDAGSTESGQPYFVMELVNGVPITEYCDRVRLTPRERLELFIPVCQAVQHAHQKGVIHRDLKPSNVMIAQYDGKPVPKVIDFGVAKATGPKLTDQTLYTGFGTVVGTLEYMSPEQAVRNQIDVDTRSDIYSLGVLLYELLTGSTPLDHKRAKKAAILELLRVIQDEEPPKPSTRLSSTDELPSIAANRGLDPKKLSGLLRGDLDWIVMKALEKDRTRRYETANGLARDLNRYLHDEPVEASPPSAAYRFRKFARRNRAAFTTVALVLATLLIGIIASVAQAIRATRAERLADERFYEAEKARDDESAQRQIAEWQRQQAEQNLKRARQAVDEYFTLVSQSKLFDVPNLQPLRRELLEAAVRYYQTLLRDRGDNSELLADLAVAHVRLAEVYHEVDRNDDAIDALASGLDLVDRLRRKFPDAKEQRRRVAGFWKGKRAGRTTEMPKDPAKAERTLTKFVRLWEILARENPTVDSFQNDLAAAYATVAEWKASAARESASPELAKAAVDDSYKALAIWEKLGQSHPDVPEYRENEVMVLRDLPFRLNGAGRQKEALAVSERALELTEKLVARFPRVPQYRADLLGSLEARAVRRESAGQTREASEDHRRKFELAQGLVAEFPAVPQYALAVFASAGGVLRTSRSGGTADATKLFREKLTPLLIFFSNRANNVTIEPQHDRDVADVLYAAGELFRNIGDPALAESAFQKCVDLNRKLTERYPNDPRHRWRLGHALRMLAFGWPDRVADAERAFIEAEKTFEKLPARYPGSPDSAEFLADTRLCLANLLAGSHRLKEAEQAYKLEATSYERLVADFPKNLDFQLRLANCHHDLANLQKSAGRIAEAEEGYRRALALKEKLVAASVANPDYRFHLAHSYMGLAYWLKETKHSQEADKSFHQALAHFEKLAADFPSKDNYRIEVGHTLWQVGYLASEVGRHEEAEKAQRRALAIFVKLGTDFPQNRYYRWEQCFSEWNIAGLMRQLGHLNDAEKALRGAIDACQKVVAEAPNDGGFRDRLARSHHDLADCLRAAKQFRDAEAQFRQAAAIWEKLADDTPSEPVFLVHAADDHLRNLMPLVQQQNRPDDAEECCRRTIALTKRLPAAELAKDDRRSLALDARAKLGELLLAKKRYADAAKNADELQIAIPGNAEACLGAASILDRCASAAFADPSLSPVDRKSKANGYHNQALDLAVKACKQGPLKPYVANNFAWSLATRPEVALRSPGAAVVLAKRAVELEPKQGIWWNTLGAAEYRAGEWNAAVEALKKSMALRNGGDSFDWFFLAMANRQLGNKEEAQRWYDQAVKRMSLNEELWRFRVEAASVLGIGESLPPFEEAARAIKAAHTFAGQGQWQKAATEYARTTQWFPGDLAHWCEYASSLVLAGDRDRYRQACGAVLKRHASDAELENLYLVARIATLVPDEIADPSSMVKLAERAVESNPKAGWYRHTLAMTDYRAGRFELAAQQCEQAMQADPGWPGHIVDWLLLAMAHHRLGHAGDARKWSDKAIKWIDDVRKRETAAAPFEFPVPSWCDRMEIELLRREAEKLIGTEKK